MSTLDTVATQLDLYTQRLSVEQLINELHIAIERITFAVETSDITTLTKTDLDLLFEQQLSEQMLSFVYWLSEQSLLSVLTGNTGRLFLNYCLKHYKSVRQIVFKTAITLPDAVKRSIADALMPRYPSGARIVFDVDPSLMAGFRIEDGAGAIDKSMRSAVAHLTRLRLGGIRG